MVTNYQSTVSVIIPAHEGWPVVMPTLASLAAQTTQALEIIIVLDHTVTWGEVPDHIQQMEPPVRPVSAARWLGPQGCRNVGIDAASGDVILFLDSSVIAVPGLIEAHLDTLARKNVIAVSGATEFIEDGHDMEWFFQFCPFVFSFSQAQDECEVIWGPTANISYRRSLVPELRFLEIFPLAGACEDVCFGYSLAPFGKVIYNPRAVVQHAFWHPFLFVFKKFTRWGTGDALLCRYALKNKGFAQLIRRQLCDAQLLLLALVATIILFFANGHTLLWSIPVLVIIHILKNVILSLKKWGLANWKGQLAAWLQIQCYVSGVIYQSFRMMDLRPIFVSVRFFPSGAFPRRKWTRGRILLTGIYLATVVTIVKTALG